ncbi:50S ribosomal protein L18 [Candidatus Pacearchaeota archaeon]|nr:50S ribosomal protein L18P [uncultured archaeon]MBS3077459.1 50S ribosomal protein L18 [Candidatus Pacearchaeota archaeon]
MPKTLRRRRRERKTDYKARFSLLKSEKPRLVVRKTNRYILVQIIDSDIAQDKVIAETSSKNLLSKGWPKEKQGSLKSLPAAYLTGFLLVKSLKTKIGEVILDIGLQRNVHGSRLYAVLKGAVDAGLKVSHNPEALPDIKMITRNEKLKSTFEKVKGAL